MKILILLIALTGCAKAGYSERSEPVSVFASGTEPQLRVRAMQMWIDSTTGCEYLVPFGYAVTDSGITPRVAADGKTHRGCRSQP